MARWGLGPGPARGVAGLPRAGHPPRPTPSSKEPGGWAELWPGSSPPPSGVSQEDPGAVPRGVPGGPDRGPEGVPIEVPTHPLRGARRPPARDPPTPRRGPRQSPPGPPAGPRLEPRPDPGPPPSGNRATPRGGPGEGPRRVRGGSENPDYEKPGIHWKTSHPSWL